MHRQLNAVALPLEFVHLALDKSSCRNDHLIVHHRGIADLGKNGIAAMDDLAFDGVRENQRKADSWPKDYRDKRAVRSVALPSKATPG